MNGIIVRLTWSPGRLAGRLKENLHAVLLLCTIMVCCTLSPALAQKGSDAGGLAEKLRLQSTTVRGEKLPVSMLLQAIGRKAGVNMVIDEAVVDTISLDLDRVNLYNLFHLILETKNLRCYESNNALIVERAADYKKDQRDVRTARLCPRYGQVAGQIEELNVMKSGDGTITASADGNCLIVRDHEENLGKIRALVNELDKPIPQVHIKARIVTIDKSISRELGIKWGYTDLNGSVSDSLSAAVDLSVANPTTSVVFGFIRDSFTLDAEISALQENKHLHILSEPRIVVLNGQEAEIKQGQEIPYESGTQENRNTTFREAVLGLKVIPKILHNDYIRLDVKVTNDSVDDNSTNDGQPLLNRQEIRTNLFLEDGVTIVIGGIMAEGMDDSEGGVPVLSDLPLVGNLFKNSATKHKSNELLVFLTPTILHESGPRADAVMQSNRLPDNGRKQTVVQPVALAAVKEKEESSIERKLVGHLPNYPDK